MRLSNFSSNEKIACNLAINLSIYVLKVSRKLRLLKPGAIIRGEDESLSVGKLGIMFWVVVQ